MAILKVKHSFETETRFVGVYLPLQTSLYLTLFSLSNEVTKSSILQSIVSDWITEIANKNPESEMIQEIGELTIQRWKEIKKERLYMTPEKYTAELIAELKKKGLPKQIIKQILKIFDDGTNK